MQCLRYQKNSSGALSYYPWRIIYICISVICIYMCFVCLCLYIQRDTYIHIICPLGRASMQGFPFRKVLLTQKPFVNLLTGPQLEVAETALRLWYYHLGQNRWEVHRRNLADSLRSQSVQRASSLNFKAKRVQWPEQYPV